VTILLCLGAAVFALLVLRFVQPALVHRVHEFVVRATINRMLLEAVEEGSPAPRNFGALLSLQLWTESGPFNNAALELRCHRLREVMAALTTGEHEGNAHERIGTGLVELADMVTILGNRFKPGAEERDEILDAEQLLQLIVQRASPTGFASLPPGTDAATMLRQNPISIVQLGEMLIAVVYALLAREQSAHLSQEFGRPSLRQMLTRSSSTSIEQRPSS
jgi:hypothetical protein